MKLIKKIESEVTKIYDIWLHSYLNGDVKTYDFYLDDDYRFIGSTDNEEFLNKADTTKFFAKTADQLAGKTDLKNTVRTIELIDGVAFLTELFDAYFLIESEWKFYGRFRFTSVLGKKKAGWRFIYQHFSMPDAKAQDGETLGAEQISKENQELRDAIKRRTVELEQKNRDLEIEAGLERVRARAMAMQNSNELSQLVDTLFQELTKLDFLLTACIINIIDGDDKSNTVWVTNQETGKEPESYHLKFEDYKFHHGMWKAWKQRKAKWVYTIEGDEKKMYDEYLFKDTEFSRFSKKAQKEFSTLDRYVASFTFSNFGGLQTVGEEPLSGESLDILARFGKVFDHTYTRFNDLKQAETQAREAQIELALERVRARTMAMQHSEELADVATVLFQQIKELGIPQWTCGFNIWETGDTEFTFYPGGPDGEILPSCKVPLMEHPVFRQFDESRSRGDELFIYEKKGEIQADHYRYMHSLPGIGDMLQGMLDQGLEFPEYQIDHIANFSYGNIVFITYEPFPEMHQVFIRFAKVFEQTYTRFLDLQKAEEQTREAQIEAALEKVRSRTMAMQHSDELPEAANVLFLEIQKLDIPAWSAGYCIWEKDKKSASCNMSSEGEIQEEFSLPTIGTGYNFYQPIKNGETFYVSELGGEKLVKHYDFMKTLPTVGEILEGFDKKGIALPTFQIWHIVYFSKGYLMFITYEPVPDAHDIFKRFAKVFDQTYTRFLDLQKAEKQTRTAQINLAVERVRAKALAMHQSEEIMGVVAKLKDEVMNLDIPDVIAATIFLNEGDDKVRMWDLSTLEKDNDEYQIPFDITFKIKKRDPHFYVKRVWENQENYFVEIQDKKGFKRIIVWLREQGKNKVADEVEEFIETTRLERLYHATKKLNNGKLCIDLLNPPSDEMETILTKMGAAFDLAYKRFEDLQKAEKQAMEAQVEAAMERIRGRVTAMKVSADLLDIVVSMRTEFIKLGHEAHYFWHMRWLPETYEKAMTSGDGTRIGTVMELPRGFHENAAMTEWENNNETVAVFPYDAEGAVDYVDKMIRLGHFHEIDHNTPGPDEIREIGGITFIMARTTHGEIGYSLPGEVAKPPAEGLATLVRFAKAFDLAYKRFEDLKKTERQMREAQIEVALERVRARALAMQKPEELIEVAQVLRREMGLLGIEALETSSIYIRDKETDTAECWYALKDAGNSKNKLVSDQFSLNLNDTWVGKQMLRFYKSKKKQVSIVMKGHNRKEWIHKCEELSAPFRGYYDDDIPDRTYHLYKFSHGAIGAATSGDISNENWELLKRTAAVFSLAYSRFRDLTQARMDLQRLKTEKHRAEEALTELKSTQTQLIQSEKMASLGELTAGIAHEIQNPLNFVNNFSELSEEMLEELEEEIKGNSDEIVTEIMTDLKQNLNKITNHGKRASSIVKGMLEHSRTSSGISELTDINKLADEYLRLSYHGLRAKDKSFNVKFETRLDQTIPKIEIIAQDVGRVILNLINNAFYAVNQKSNESSKKYQPTVNLITRKKANTIEVIVKDNGSGISKEKFEKIFQPFFTTKPTGEGTGLGLSLAYDIITKGHGGELKVESKEGEGTEFTIVLPIK